MTKMQKALTTDYKRLLTLSNDPKNKWIRCVFFA